MSGQHDTTAEHDWLVGQFEANRGHLRAVAYRMLGSMTEADDAVQESWLRLNRSDASEVANLSGWLTTVVARVSLDMLRTRKSRREDSLVALPSEPLDGAEVALDPAHEAEMADSLGLALLVVLETLTPAERLAFVLHDLFDVSFEEIALIVGRTPTAARQLASRARRRVRGAKADPDSDVTGQRAIVAAFLSASRGGDFAALLAALDPEVTLRADATAALMGATSVVNGAQAVAETFAGRARAAQLALIDGAPGLVWSTGDEPRMVFAFTIAAGKITAITMLADPERLKRLHLEIIGD